MASPESPDGPRCPECGAPLINGYTPLPDGDVEPTADCTNANCTFRY